jgi:GDP-L-fucose synthase
MILITGGTGFVGKHLQEELTARGMEHAVFSKREYDLTIREQADSVFDRYRHADVILHLASYQAAADFPAKHPADQFYINSSIHTNVLEGWRKFAPKAKLIALGSSCAYPSRAETLVEDRLLDGEIHGSVYSYAFTKRLIYTGILAYNDQYGLNGSYLIPPTMYGEYDDFNVETAHVCGALIGKFARAVCEGLPEVEIWGDGTQVREFIYVKEFIRALLYLTPLCDRDIVNVGPGRGTSIRILAETISRATGFKGRLLFNMDRYVGIQEKFLNTDKLASKYNWRVGEDLSAGIGRTVEWYLRNYGQLKDARKFQ